MIFLAVVAIVALILTGYMVFSWASTRLDKNRKAALAYAVRLRAVEKSVREIANTSTDPDSRLQASILLDEIAQTYDSKELL
jgi:hypothetical protein